jgi:hypothetical protein
MRQEEQALSFSKAFNNVERLSTFTSTTPLQLTLYLDKVELVCLEQTPYTKEYMVYVNRPFWKNGKDGFEVRSEKTEKQYIFLETKSWNVAFNMVKRIAKQRKYPKVKLAW